MNLLIGFVLGVIAVIALIAWFFIALSNADSAYEKMKDRISKDTEND